MVGDFVDVCIWGWFCMVCGRVWVSWVYVGLVVLVGMVIGSGCESYY